VKGDLPCELVAIPNPKVLGLTQLGLDLLRIPDLLEEYTLCVVLSVTAVDDLGDVSNE
jgi:hypothetical protein